MECTRIIKRIFLAETLKSMPINSTLRISNHAAKTGTVRASASRLKKHGFLFEVKDKGLIDECIVTRLK